MSENVAKNELLIPFESFTNRGIHKEKAESFRESFFKELYNQASEIVVMINKSNRNKKIEDIINNWSFEQKLLDVQNVIAFTGRRGTGKTSVMLAFADSLVAGEYSDKAKEELKNTRFYSFPYIDASLLEKDEDIIEIVLSKMIMELNEKINTPNHRSLTQFEAYYNDVKENIVNVYNQYASLKKADTFDSTSSCSVMEKIAEKHDVRYQIVKLVKKYIDCMITLDTGHVLNQFQREGDNGYLAICIDDIDMSQKSQMEIMQSIYQYLMIPNVIVMVSLNFPMLSASIEKEFYQKICTSNSEEKDSIHLSKEQTYNFLKKVIPFDMRITTPSWRKQDYRSLTLINVYFGKQSDKKSILEAFPRLEKVNLFELAENEKNIKFAPKELIMIMLAYRTKTFLDVTGDKLHFMQPDSLRNLNDLFYLFYNMNIMDHSEKNNADESEKYHRDLEANRRILLNYLYFKMIPEYNFSSDEDQVLKEFARDTVRKKGRRIWDYYYQLISQNDKKERIERLYGIDFYEVEMRKNKVENYSFGELFRILYFGSRLSLMSKEFVQTILASFSFSMPQFIEMAKHEVSEFNKKQKNGNENNEYEIMLDDKTKLKIKDDDKYGYKRIRDVFRYTLLGTWCVDLFDKRNVDIIISKKIKTEKRTAKELDEYIESFIYLLMLSPMSTGEKIPVSENGDQIRISANLDPTAFIMNSVRIKRLTDMKFLDKNSDSSNKDIYLTDRIYSYFNVKKSNDELEKMLEEIIKENESETEKIKIHWYMLKNIDLTYNVIKRAVAYQIYRSDNNLRDKKISKDDPFEIIKSFYNRLKDKLQEEADVYTRGGLSEYDFGKEFAKHPVVKFFISNDVKDIRYQDKSTYVSIDWSANNDETIAFSNTMTLKKVFDYCAVGRPEIVSTLNEIYSSKLSKRISNDFAKDLIELILTCKVKKVIEKINEQIKPTSKNNKSPRRRRTLKS